MRKMTMKEMMDTLFEPTETGDRDDCNCVIRYASSLPAPNEATFFASKKEAEDFFRQLSADNDPRVFVND
jgi:hypothetical protein